MGSQYTFGVDIRHVGSKYDPELSTAKVAALVRAEIRQAIRDGELPAGKYSTISTHDSIMVTLRELDIARTHRLTTLSPYGTPQASYVPTFGAKQAWERCRNIVDNYRFDSSDPQVDHVNTNFYASIDLPANAAERDDERFTAVDEFVRRTGLNNLQYDAIQRLLSDGRVSESEVSTWEALVVGTSLDPHHAMVAARDIHQHSLRPAWTPADPMLRDQQALVRNSLAVPSPARVKTLMNELGARVIGWDADTLDLIVAASAAKDLSAETDELSGGGSGWKPGICSAMYMLRPEWQPAKDRVGEDYNKIWDTFREKWGSTTHPPTKLLDTVLVTDIAPDLVEDLTRHILIGEQASNIRAKYGVAGLRAAHDQLEQGWPVSVSALLEQVEQQINGPSLGIDPGPPELVVEPRQGLQEAVRVAWAGHEDEMEAKRAQLRAERQPRKAAEQLHLGMTW